MTPITVKNSGGLGNRINSLASAMAVNGRNVHLYWPINRACPVRFDEIMTPLPGVEVTEWTKGDFPPIERRNEITWPKAINAHHLPRHEFMSALRRSYHEIHLSLSHKMTGEPYGWGLKATPLGFHYRHHAIHQGLTPNFRQFLAVCLEVIEALDKVGRKPDTVYLATDSEPKGYEFGQIMSSRGVLMAGNKIIRPRSDVDRDEGRTQGFVLDLLSLTKCRNVVFNNPLSTVVDSLTASDIDTYCTQPLDGSRRIPRPMEVQNHLQVEQLLAKIAHYGKAL